MANSEKEYSMTLVKNNLGQYSELQMIDLVTQTVTPLVSDTTIYNFTATNNGVVENRFIFIASQAPTGLNSTKGNHFLLDGYLKDNNVLVASNYSPNEGALMLFNASGSLLMSEKLSIGTSQTYASLKPGVYVLRLEASGQINNIKILVNNQK